MPSRHRTGDSHYYLAVNCPDNYYVNGCSHPDVSDEDLEVFREGLPEKYKQNMACLLTASTQADFKTMQLALGLCNRRSSAVSLVSHCLYLACLLWI